MNVFAAILVLGLAGGDGPAGIDRAIEAKAPASRAARSGDAEFLRRVTLDLAGRIPSIEELRAFEADADPAKRERLVDRLIATPAFAERMEEALSVMFLERRTGKTIPESEWKSWLRGAIGRDEPYDRIVGQILGSHGTDAATRGATKFFLDGRSDPNDMTRDIGRIFLGRDLLCAQCHNHPNVLGWKQSDYMGLHAYLANSKTWTDEKRKLTFLMEVEPAPTIGFESVFSPGKKRSTPPALPGMPPVEVPAAPAWKTPPPKKGQPGIPEFSLKERLAKDLANPANAQFVRTAVNRIWGIFMGRGLVHPPDQDHAQNPPSHPEVLDLLAKGFVEDGLRLRPLVRRIVTSEAYQRSSLLPEGTEAGKVKASEYRAALLRPLSAEQLARSVPTALGASPAPQLASLFVQTFGGAPGDGEIEYSPSTVQALFLMNGSQVRGWLDAFAKARAAEPDDARLAAELYGRLLSRRPEPAETARARAHLGAAVGGRETAVRELAWALLASAEFRFNH
jgi:hypothetical protein